MRSTKSDESVTKDKLMNMENISLLAKGGKNLSLRLADNPFLFQVLINIAIQTTLKIYILQFTVTLPNDD